MASSILPLRFLSSIILRFLSFIPPCFLLFFPFSSSLPERDLKSGNVLVNKRLVAKITDFGSMSGKLSRIQQEAATDSNTHASAPVAETRLEYSPSTMSKTVCLTMTDGVGTPLYMAPEILDPQLRKLSLKADVFSFGVLMWEISECRVPDLLAQEIGDDFSGFVMQTLLQLYRDGKHLHFGDIDDDDDKDKDKDSEKKNSDRSSSTSSSCEGLVCLACVCVFLSLPPGVFSHPFCIISSPPIPNSTNPLL